MVPRVSGKRLLLVESDLSMGPGFARQGSNLLSAPENIISSLHSFSSLATCIAIILNACPVCLLEYLYLSLFVWIHGLGHFFYEEDLIHIKLASAIPVKPHLFIYSFIQAFEFLSWKMRIRKHRRRRIKNQESRIKKTAKCPIKKQKIIKCLVIDCTADFYYIDCNSFTQPGNSHMLCPLPPTVKYMYAVEHF